MPFVIKYEILPLERSLNFAKQLGQGKFFLAPTVNLLIDYQGTGWPSYLINNPLSFNEIFPRVLII